MLNKLGSADTQLLETACFSSSLVKLRLQASGKSIINLSSFLRIEGLLSGLFFLQLSVKTNSSLVKTG